MNTGGPAFPQHGWSKDPQVLELERELNAANERIKRLEEAGDAMHRYYDASSRFKWEWQRKREREKQAKETKP